jgi:hypothetical protein
MGGLPAQTLGGRHDLLPVVLDIPNDGRGPARQARPAHALPVPLLRRPVLAMTAAFVLIVAAVLVALAYGAVTLARWARRTDRRPWVWLLSAYVAANILWAILRPLIAHK